MVMTFNIVHDEIGCAQESSGWILKEKGLKNFKNLTEQEFYQIQRDKGVNENYNAWYNRFVSAADRCFKRSKTGDSKPPPVLPSMMPLYEKLMELKKCGKQQRIVASEYIQMIKQKQAEIVAEKNREKIKEVTKVLTEKEQLSPNGFWKLAKAVKKKVDNRSSVIHNGTEILGPEFIKGAYKSEFQFRLREREIDPRLEEYQKKLTELVANYIKHAQQLKNEPPFTMEELKVIIDSLLNKKASGSDWMRAEMIKAGGEGFLQSLLDLYNYMKERSCVPHRWEHVLVCTLYKNKGSKKELVNYRGIFLTALLSKIFEKLVKKRISNILTRINKFQAGGRAERGTVDHLFIARAVIDYYKYLKVPLYITLYDYKQAFDSLWLDDCILSMWNIGVRNEMLPLIYKLNLNAEVTIKTPFGPADSFLVKKLVKQGTVLGTALCGTSTAEYCDINDGVPIGEDNYGPLAFVDDLMQMNITPHATRMSHARALVFTILKRLGFNAEKCFGVVVCDRGIQKEINFPELKIGDHIIEEKVSAAYLGDFVHNEGGNTSTIDDRVKKGSSRMVGALALVDDVTFGVHKFSTQMLVYRAVFIPTMLTNSESWSNIKPKEFDKLRVVQLKYLKRVLGVPTSCSNAFVFLELGVLPVDQEIHLKQLSYLWKLLNMSDDEPMYKLYKLQAQLPLQPCWRSGIAATRELYSIDDDATIRKMSRESYKRYIKKKIRTITFTNLKNQLLTNKKVSNLVYEQFNQQSYLSVVAPRVAQVIARIRSQTLNIAPHRPYLFGGHKDALCRHCKLAVESVHHIINCYTVSSKREVLGSAIYGEDFDVVELSRLANLIYTFLL